MNQMNINKLTPEQVAAIKTNGGFSGSLKGGLDIEAPSSSAPAQSIPISGYGTDVRGTWGRKEFTELVKSPDLTKHLAAHNKREQEEAAHKAALLAEREELREVTDPKKLQAQIQFMDRQIKKLIKDVNALKKASSSS